MKYVCQYSYYDIFIAGFGHYDTSMVSDNDSVELIAEPENQYDSKAVAVTHSGKVVGYIPKGILQDMYHDYIRKGGKVNATITSSKKMAMQLDYLLPVSEEDSECTAPTIFSEEIVRSLNDEAFTEYSKSIIDYAKSLNQNSVSSETYDKIMAALSVIKDESDKRTKTKQDIVVSLDDSDNKSERVCDKWLSWFLCSFLGMFGAHKFYEGRKFMGVLYIFTFGLFGFGAIIDSILILLKPGPYYVVKNNSGRTNNKQK